MEKQAIKNKQQRTIHLVMWGVYGGVLIYFLHNTFDPAQAVARGLLITGLHAGLFYTNTEILIPRLLARKRVLFYWSGVVVLFMLIGFLIHLIDAWYFDARFHFPDRMMKRIMEHNEPSDRHHQMFARHVQRMVTARLFFNGLTSLALLFVGTSRKLLQMAENRARMEAGLREENLHTEMKFLRSQVNPHFLFNVLNNVYSLSVIKSDKTPEMILKLSDLLRYNLYESNEKEVLLEMELAYIRNFIALQQLKSEQQLQVSVHLLNEAKETRIPPMLFIPFVENAFKHSHIEDIEHGWIRLQLENNADRLVFEISNSLPKKQYTKDKTEGIGLANVQRRLELLYPNLHALTIVEDTVQFKVNLILTHHA